MVGTWSRLTFGLLAALAACDIPPVVPVSGPAGQSGWLQVSCNKGIRQCQERATRACPKGYEVVDRRGDSSAYTSPSGLDEASGAPGEGGSMVIACK